MSENALLKRYELLKIFVIYCDSCKKCSKIPPSARMQASIRRTLSNVPFVLEMIVNAFWIHSQSIRWPTRRPTDWSAATDPTLRELSIKKFTYIPSKMWRGTIMLKPHIRQRVSNETSRNVSWRLFCNNLIENFYQLQDEFCPINLWALMSFRLFDLSNT